jgi:hypothetical protein
LLAKAFEHQTHHRGQATVYLRLKGVAPPNEMLFNIILKGCLSSPFLFNIEIVPASSFSLSLLLRFPYYDTAGASKT